MATSKKQPAGTFWPGLLIVPFIAACACTRSPENTPPPQPTPSTGGTVPAPVASTPVADASVAPTADKPPACMPGMTEISGSYCSALRHYCLEGYPSIGSSWTKYYPNGAVGVTYCEKYVVGRAECTGSERPLHFCIDTYEYPGQGELPMVEVTWYEAERRCRARGQRLCKDDEWTLACEGPNRTPYPYGWQRDESVCNIGRTPERGVDTRTARMALRVPSGSMPGCVSPFGVYDMTGNADEWCRDVTTRGASMERDPFISVFKGGHMLGKVRNRCRPATVSHGPTFSLDVEGFRCCADVTAQ